MATNSAAALFASPLAATNRDDLMAALHQSPSEISAHVPVGSDDDYSHRALAFVCADPLAGLV